MSGQLLEPCSPAGWHLTSRRHSFAHGLDESSEERADPRRRRSIQESISSLTRSVSTGLRLAIKRNSHVQLEEFDIDRRAVLDMMINHYEDNDVKITKLLCRRRSSGCEGEEHELEVWLRRGGERKRLDLLVRPLNPGDTESKVYHSLVADLRHYLDDEKPGLEKLLPVPHSYRLNNQADGLDSHTDILVVESLGPRGYRPASGSDGEGLDYEHAVLAVSRLARLHAISYCYRKEKQMDIVTTYPCLANRPPAPLSSNTLLRLENIFQQNPKFLPHAQLFLDFAKIEDHSSELEENLEVFGVLCHGDFSLDHLLFQYKSELESQLFCSDMVAKNLSKAHYGPASIDLLQFVFTSLESEVRQEFLTSLICSVYYDTLASTVATIAPGLKIFSKHQFLQETDRLLLHGFLAGLRLQTELYEDELLHALPCAAPPSYTEYRDRVLSMARDLLQFRAICAKSRH